MCKAFSRNCSPNRSEFSLSLNRIPAVAAILVCAAALVGCSTFRDAYRVDAAFYFGAEQSADVKTGEIAEDFRPVNLETYQFPGNNGGQPAYKESLGDNKKRKRLQTILLRMSDKVCEQHKGAIIADAAFFNMGLSFTTTVLSGASAIVGGETAKTILAGLAGMTNAGQSILNEQVYRQKMAELIVIAIDVSREEAGVEIALKWQNGNGENYTTDEAIRDAYLYHQRCSFFHGIQIIAKKIDEKGIDKNQVLQRMSLIRAEITKNLAHYKELLDQTKPVEGEGDFAIESKKVLAEQANLALETIEGLQQQLKNLNLVLQISQ